MSIFENYYEAQRIKQKIDPIIDQVRQLDVKELRCAASIVIETLALKEEKNFYEVASTLFAATITAHRQTERVMEIAGKLGEALKEDKE